MKKNHHPQVLKMSPKRSISSLAISILSFCSNEVQALLASQKLSDISTSRRRVASRILSSTTQRSLIPLSSLDDCSFLNNASDSYRLCFDEEGKLTTGDSDNSDGDYVLSIIEKDDISTVSQLQLECFSQDLVTLSDDMQGIERALLGPVVNLLTWYSDAVGYFEVSTGIQSRASNRMERASSQRSNLVQCIDDVNSGSIVLALGNQKGAIVASVEVRLQPTDGKIPFSQPGLDDTERKIALELMALPFDTIDRTPQPYLSNLCVAETCRGKGIGKALVRCVESIATDWGYDKLYLHVDPKNDPAFKLYEKEGFVETNVRWNPFWAGGAASIAYLVKRNDSR